MSSEPPPSNKDALMASLMGADSANGILPAPEATTEELPFANNTNPTAATGASLLMQSGLLGEATNNNGGGGGLFDDIDQQEEEKRKQQQQEALRQQQQQQQEAQRQAELQRQQEQEQQQRLQQEQQQQQQQQQQQLQDQMQSIHLGLPQAYGNHQSYGTPPRPYGQQLSSPQQILPPSSPQMGQQQLPSMPQQAPMPQMQQPSQMQQQPPQMQQQQQPPQMQQSQMQQQQPPQMQQSRMQQQQQQQPPQMQPGFYRDQSDNISTLTTPTMAPQQQPNYYAGQQQQPNMHPNHMAGMHNANPSLGRPPQLPTPTQPPPPPVVYGHVTVDQPLLVSTKSGLFGGISSHWSYQISVQVMAPNQQQPAGVWVVRRRFRHVVALEERLHEDCPGAILPPRPEKHATRAIEEASAQQSTEFAVQRAAELQVYLNQVVQHPIACKSPVLRLFLSLQDDMGAAWPEVSSNALTRLANVGVGAAVKASEATSSTKMPWQKDGAAMPDESGEDNAELLALYSAESVRMGAVLQAVPKMEGAVTLLREHSEQMGVVGMEVGRMAKEVEATDRELGQPLDIVSNGMLRSGRRSKRLALELSAAMHTFSQQYKLCRYERMAFADRKAALQRRVKERGRADGRAAQLWHQQQQQQMYGSQQYNYHGGGGYPQPQPNLNHMQRDAVLSDTYAADAAQECEEIGQRLKSEVNRIAWQRRTEWNQSVKVIASAMKEASSERVGIWEGVQETFLQNFPEMNVPSQPHQQIETSQPPQGMPSQPPQITPSQQIQGMPPMVSSQMSQPMPPQQPNQTMHLPPQAVPSQQG